MENIMELFAQARTLCTRFSSFPHKSLGGTRLGVGMLCTVVLTLQEGEEVVNLSCLVP